LGMQRDGILSDVVCNHIRQLVSKAKLRGIEDANGGAVTFDSLPFFQSLPQGCLNHFETRKIIFKCPEALANGPEAFAMAMNFELLWLQHKNQYNQNIANEDLPRIDMLQQRYDTLQNEMNAVVNE